MSHLTPEEIAYYQEHAADDLRPNEIASLVCGLFFASLAVGLRITARRIARIPLGPEDWTILVAMLGEITYAVVFAMAIDNGEGRHIIFLKDVVSFAKGYVVAIVSYSTTVMLTKISILIFYCRLFRSRWLIRISWLIAIVVVGYSLAVIFIAGLQCIPLSDLWEAGPSCINTKPPFTALAIVNIITDVAILTLPIKPVLQLNMRTARKVQVLCIFLLGGVVCIFDIVRAIAMRDLSIKDPSWTAVGAGIWSFVEMSVGIVAACLPTLAPLLKSRHSSSTTHTATGEYVRSRKLSGPRSTHQEQIYCTDDWMRCETGAVMGYDRPFVGAHGDPPGSLVSSSHENGILVRKEIQHKTTCLQ